MKIFTPIKSSLSSFKLWLTMGLGGGCLFLFLFLGPAPVDLVYNRTAVSHGEIYRLFTGHFVHCDINHLGWNIAAFFILAGLLEQRLGLRLLGLVAMCCLGVSGWLWFVKTDLLLYCGLSGMLNGLLLVLLVLLWQESKDPVVLLIGACALLKIVFEAANDYAIFTHLSWASVPGTHGAGLAAGVVYLVTGGALEGRVARTRS